MRSPSRFFFTFLFYFAVIRRLILFTARKLCWGNQFGVPGWPPPSRGLLTVRTATHVPWPSSRYKSFLLNIHDARRGQLETVVSSSCHPCFPGRSRALCLGGLQVVAAWMDDERVWRGTAEWSLPAAAAGRRRVRVRCTAPPPVWGSPPGWHAARRVQDNGNGGTTAGEYRTN